MKENKMGYVPIPKLLFSISAPIALSMLFQSLYNVVDSIFVSRVGEEALAAVSLAYPVQMLIIAVAVGTGVGMNALLSKSLGEKKFTKANLIAQTGFVLAVLSSLIFIIFGLFFVKQFFVTQTSSLVIQEHGVLYLKIVTTLSTGIFVQVTLERLLQSTGQSFYSMITQMGGVILNIILDPILIFGMGPFPKLGVAGAAYATVGAQFFAAGIGLYLNFSKNKELNFLQRGFTLNPKILKNIYSVGLPSILMMSINSVGVFVMNNILAIFSSTAVVAYGIYFKLQSFVFMPVFGINNGLISIIAYNYGARKKERIYQAIKAGYIGGSTLMFIGLLIFQIFPTQLLGLFDPSPELLNIGIPALRIISIGFLLAGITIVGSAIFQSLGSGVLSMITMMIRQFIFLGPVAYLLSLTGDVNKVWFSLPIAELFAVFATIYFLRNILKKKVEVLTPLE